jgi:hypothetical protein
MARAHQKRKSALYKSKIADANFREAILKAKLSRSRAQRARQALGAAYLYLHHARWTVQRSKQSDSLSNSRHVTTTTAQGVHGTQGMQTVLMEPVQLNINRLVNHIVNIPGGSVAITLD